MATETEWSPAEHLLKFVDDVIEWVDSIGARHLPAPESVQLKAATTEFHQRQRRQLQRELAEAGQADFEAAGFTVEQATFKTSVARRTMREAKISLAKRPRFRRPKLEDVEAALGAVKEVLGSIASLSKWIEAVAELVGIVGSGIKRVASMKRTQKLVGAVGGLFKRLYGRRGQPRREDAPA